MDNEAEEIMREADRKVMTLLEGYSGPIVRELAQDQAAARENVNNSDPKVRFAALSVVDSKWGVTQQIADMCEGMAVGDPDAKVRGAAVLCLRHYYKKTANVRIAKLLAEIVSNEEESLDVRGAAFEGIFYLREPDILKWPVLPGFKFPDDVDWDLVNACILPKDN